MPISNQPPATIRLLIVEDHNSIRELMVDAFEAIEGFEVAGSTNYGKEAMELSATLKPDVVVLDAMLPDFSGLDCVKAIRRNSPATKILVFSANASPVLLSRAMELGVSGYLEKSSGFRELTDAVRLVATGATCFGHSIATTVSSLQKSPFPLDAVHRLSVRERTVLAGIAAGKNSKMIADQLGLSLFTVNNHRRRIKDKTGLRTTSDLTLHALSLGLVQDHLPPYAPASRPADA